MFKQFICGIHTDHKKGYTINEYPAKRYLLMCFTSPFFFLNQSGERIEAKAGTCVINKPGDRVVHGPIDDNSSFVNHWIWFDADEEIISMGIPFNTPVEVTDTEVFSECIANIISEDLKKDEFTESRISDEIFKMLVEVKRALKPRTEFADTVTEKFNALRVHVFNRCGEKWTLEKMAKLSGYSISRFCNIYVTLFKKSPMDDLLDWRLEFAKRLLVPKTYNVSEIAEMCGFSSVHYFSRFFAAKTGNSPKKYK